MESLSSSAHQFLTLPLKKSSTVNQQTNLPLLYRNGHSSFSHISSQNPFFRTINRSFMVQSKKGNSDNNKKNKKMDSHNFAPKPDESIGPFPEAVLLKQKKVQEDGRVLPEFADEEEQQLFEFLNLQLESDLNVEEMRHYEVVYLIHQDHKDKVDDVNSKIQDFLREKRGRVWSFSDWGMRRLAYKIKKATHAHYILMNFEIGNQWINEFKQMLDQDERVIRHLVIKRDKAITEECPPPPEFHTLRADMVDEYEVDDMEEDDEEEEEHDDYDEEEHDLEGYENDDEEIKSVSMTKVVRGTGNQKTVAKAKENLRHEKVLR